MEDAYRDACRECRAHMVAGGRGRHRYGRREIMRTRDVKSWALLALAALILVAEGVVE